MKNNNHLNKFLKFNLIVIIQLLLLFIINYYIPKTNLKFRSNILINCIFPMIFFTCFSFIFGALFLIGNNYMKDYLLDYISNETLEIGITASYSGMIAIIISYIIKNIIEKSLNLIIKSNIILDLIGFLLGRVILLTLVMLNYI
jgi:hypothetical protein